MIHIFVPTHFGDSAGESTFLAMAQYGLEINSNNFITPSIYATPEVQFASTLNRSINVAIPVFYNHESTVQGLYGGNGIQYTMLNNATTSNFNNISSMQQEFVPPNSSAIFASPSVSQTSIPMNNRYGRIGIMGSTNNYEPLYVNNFSSVQ